MRQLERPSTLPGLGSSGVVGRVRAALGATAGALALAAMVLCQAFPGPADRDGVLEQDLSSLAKPLARSEREAIVARARAVLRRSPLKASAVSLIGHVRRVEGRTRDANLLFSAAWKLSHREASADLWLFEKGMAERRYPEAFLHADALLRREPTLRMSIFPLLLASIGDPTAISPLVERLSLNPDWRRPFFATAFEGPDGQRAATLLWALKDAGDPAMKVEVEAYLSALVAGKRYEQALLAWMLFLPSAELQKVGGIFDGDFSDRSTFVPFGWQLESGGGGTVGVESSDGGGGALAVELFGQPAPNLARQLLVLPPGRHRFTLRTRSTASGTGSPLAWTVSCAEDGRPLARLDILAGDESWRTLSVLVDVPQSGCAGQLLKLAADGPDRTISRLWFDDLTISPLESSRP